MRQPFLEITNKYFQLGFKKEFKCKNVSLGKKKIHEPGLGSKPAFIFINCMTLCVYVCAFMCCEWNTTFSVVFSVLFYCCFVYSFFCDLSADYRCKLAFALIWCSTSNGDIYVSVVHCFFGNKFHYNYSRNNNMCMLCSSGRMVVNEGLWNLRLGSGPSRLSRGHRGQLLRALPGYSCLCIYCS